MADGARESRLVRLKHAKLVTLREESILIQHGVSLRDRRGNRTTYRADSRGIPSTMSWTAQQKRSRETWT
jgi:hypothetical protein